MEDGNAYIFIENPFMLFQNYLVNICLIFGEGFGGKVMLLINYKPVDCAERYC